MKLAMLKDWGNPRQRREVNSNLLVFGSTISSLDGASRRDLLSLCLLLFTLLATLILLIKFSAGI